MSISPKDFFNSISGIEHLNKLQEVSEDAAKAPAMRIPKKGPFAFGRKETRMKATEMTDPVKVQKIADIISKDFSEVQKLMKKHAPEAQEKLQKLGKIAENFDKQERSESGKYTKKQQARLDLYTKIITEAKKNKVEAEQQQEKSKSKSHEEQKSPQVESLSSESREQPRKVEQQPPKSTSKFEYNKVPTAEEEKIESMLSGSSDTEEYVETKPLTGKAYVEDFNKGAMPRPSEYPIPEEKLSSESESESFGAMSREDASKLKEMKKPETTIETPKETPKQPMIRPSGPAPKAPHEDTLKDLPFGDVFEHADMAQKAFESRLPRDALVRNVAVSRFKENLSHLSGMIKNKVSLNENNKETYFLVLSHKWKNPPFELRTGEFSPEVKMTLKNLDQLKSNIQENNHFANGKRLSFSTTPTLSQYEKMSKNLIALQEMRPGRLIKDDLDLSNLSKEEEAELVDLIQNGTVDKNSISLAENRIVQVGRGLGAIKKEIQNASKECFSAEINEALLPDNAGELSKLRGYLTKLKEALPRADYSLTEKKKIHYENSSAKMIIQASKDNKPVEDTFYFPPYKKDEKFSELKQR